MSYHILIADDQRSIANLWARGFKQEGYHVTVTYNWLETVKFLKETNTLPDVLLLDQMMPYGEVMDALRVLATRDTERRVLVFLVTAEPRVQDTDVAPRLDGFLHKPVLMRDLLKMVEDKLNVGRV